jgi:hypothetical protein
MSARDLVWQHLVPETLSPAKEIGLGLGAYVAEARYPRDSWEAVDSVVNEVNTASRKNFEVVHSLDDARSARLRREFDRLANEWKIATAFSSSLSAAATHPSYQRIIGLGPDAISLVLNDLEMTGAPWFWALRALTGEDPVPAAHSGQLDKMREDWLDWGRRRHRI